MTDVDNAAHLVELGRQLNQRQAMPQAAPGWKAAPHLPPIDHGPTAADITAVVGDEALAAPVAAREKARQAAEAALGQLASHRLGGDAWKAALAADAAAVSNGKAPGKLADLLAGDDQRWAIATAAVEAHRQAAARAKADLDRDALDRAITKVMDDAAVDWATAAAEGWSARADLAKAWQHRRTGETALVRWRTADQIAAWLQGRNPRPPRRVTDYRPEDRLPIDQHARGYWFCLQLVTEPEQKWWRIPTEGVAWPLGADKLLDKALRKEAVHAAYGQAAEVTSQPAGGSRVR